MRFLGRQRAFDSDAIGTVRRIKTLDRSGEGGDERIVIEVVRRTRGRTSGQRAWQA